VQNPFSIGVPTHCIGVGRCDWPALAASSGGRSPIQTNFLLERERIFVRPVFKRAFCNKVSAGRAGQSINVNITLSFRNVKRKNRAAGKNPVFKIVKFFSKSNAKSEFYSASAETLTSA
jgi:hypothetical protein